MNGDGSGRPRRVAGPASGARPGGRAAAAGGTRRQAPDSARRLRWPGYLPSPELLAQVDALPPATDTPGVDLARPRAGDPRFTLRSCCGRSPPRSLVGLVLDGLDALASLAHARPGPGRHRPRRGDAGLPASSSGRVVGGPADRPGGLGHHRGRRPLVVGRNGERLLYTLRVKIFAHLQRLGLDFYERELSGRIMTRMTTDVDALSSFLQTGLITMVNSAAHVRRRADRAAGHQPARWGSPCWRIVRRWSWPRVVFQTRSSRGLHRRAGEGQRGQRRPAGERGRPAGVPGLPPGGAQRGQRFAGLQRRATGSSRLRAQRYIALYFPFVAVAVHRSPGRWCCVVRGGPDAQRRADRGRAHRLPALHRHAVLPGAAAVAGVRRLPAGRGRACAGSPTCCGRPPRPRRQPAPPVGAGAARRGSSCATCTSATPRQRARGAGRGQPDRRRPARPWPWSAQTGAGKSTLVKLVRQVLRRDRRAGAGGRRRRPRLRPGQLPAPAGRRPAGGVPVRGHGPGRDRLRPAGRQRRRGRGGGPGGRRAST